MRLDGAIDLSTVASCGPRVARARAMLNAIIDGARGAMTESAGDPALAFVVLAEGNRDLDEDLLVDTLAVAALLLTMSEPS